MPAMFELRHSRGVVVYARLSAQRQPCVPRLPAPQPPQTGSRGRPLVLTPYSLFVLIRHTPPTRSTRRPGASEATATTASRTDAWRVAACSVLELVGLRLQSPHGRGARTLRHSMGCRCFPMCCAGMPGARHAVGAGRVFNFRVGAMRVRGGRSFRRRLRTPSRGAPCAIPTRH
jgi:hypothetical protein